jgi:energy-coupling factor transporter transmembrane protein EcfT
MSDTTINAIWFTLMCLLLIVSCAMAFLSFIWLVAAAASGVGLMPWLLFFLTSLVFVWITAGQVEL